MALLHNSNVQRVLRRSENKLELWKSELGLSKPITKLILNSIRVCIHSNYVNANITPTNMYIVYIQFVDGLRSS